MSREAERTARVRRLVMRCVGCLQSILPEGSNGPDQTATATVPQTSRLSVRGEAFTNRRSPLSQDRGTFACSGWRQVCTCAGWPAQQPGGGTCHDSFASGYCGICRGGTGYDRVSFVRPTGRPTKWGRRWWRAARPGTRRQKRGPAAGSKRLPRARIAAAGAGPTARKLPAAASSTTFSRARMVAAGAGPTARQLPAATGPTTFPRAGMVAAGPGPTARQLPAAASPTTFPRAGMVAAGPGPTARQLPAAASSRTCPRTRMVAAGPGPAAWELPTAGRATRRLLTAGRAQLRAAAGARRAAEQRRDL